eukprot:Phypoly_transcript_12440.p1 GENE.Phypoly_transcript_12440~~Phypoly_transcript_12440.p1  ORF type:complete len:375 (+),score=56.00 Phypoly_transcript_12440:56-1126(+)
MSVEQGVAGLDIDEYIYEPTIQNLLEKTSLKWIFVGGKGGVGKTTVSSSIAVQMSKVRESVLIISTDPAHNLSDAFGQKFTKYPTLVEGFTNLSAMEIDPTFEKEDLEAEAGMPDPLAGLGLQDMITSMPGIDEAMGFAEVMKQVKSMEYSVIIFDTAPTGHTLRFLSFPAALQKGFSKIFSLKSKFGGLFQQMSSILMPGGGFDQGEMESKFDSTQKIIEEVNSQFKNSELTTFVPVMIPEFLSLYETERLIQELTKNEMDVINIVVNQILYAKGDNCELCSTRSKMQNKYLTQVEVLYPDFHVVKLPLLSNEVRGIQSLLAFSKYLLTPYVPEAHTHTSTTTTTTTSTTSLSPK